jgi:hypothetical protein
MSDVITANERGGGEYSVCVCTKENRKGKKTVLNRK